jgi:rhodanese-related sulfurtransferase
MIKSKRKGMVKFGAWALWVSGFLLFLGAQGFAEDIPKVKPEELKEMIEKGDPSIVIVDTQPKGVYDLGHIKGAVNLPWAPNLKSHGNLPKDKTLILYCDCAHEEDSTDVATQLMEKWGYTDIKILEGGWSKWLKAGYPIEKNK